MLCRPKEAATLQIQNWKFVVHLNPQQKWEYEEDNLKTNYRVSRDNVTLNLTKEEFEKWFKI